MSWIKRNLLFVVGSLVAVALLGLAGYFLYAKWNLNNEVLTNLNTDYEELKGLNGKNPHPGAGPIDNIKLAKQQREQLLDFLKKTRAYFEPIPRVPDLPKITDRDFSAALSQTIEQLRTEATNASVALPPDNYSFSFTSQKSKISFAPGSLDRVAVQLGEIKALAEIFFAAKINSLDNLRRERVSADDSFGLQSDYLSDKTTTNALAVLTPYEVTFRSFSSELAAVLAGMASSPHGFLVKTVNVELAPAVAAPETPATTVTTYTAVQPQLTPFQEQFQQQQAQQDAASAFARRYGISAGAMGGGANSGGVQYRGLNSGQPTMTYAPPPTGVPGAAPANKGALPTVLDEKLLKITLNLYIVKLLPQK